VVHHSHLAIPRESRADVAFHKAPDRSIEFSPAVTRRAGSAAPLTILMTVFLTCTHSMAAGSQEHVIRLIDAGQFQSAEAQIAQRLRQETGQDREALEFQRERMRRILLDFSLTEADAEARLRQQIPDLTDAQFAAWDQAGLLEHQVIDGRKLYFNRAPSNLFRLNAAAAARRKNPIAFNDSPLEKPHPHHGKVRDAALASGKSSVAPHRVRITQSITVEPDVIPAGETLRAWLPFPRSLPGQQEDIELTASSPAKNAIAPETTLQRTVYLERIAQAHQPTTFSITYELTVFGQYHAIDPANCTTPSTTWKSLPPAWCATARPSTQAS
jgi:hypothetical protein